jgi:hypothetical protein
MDMVGIIRSIVFSLLSLTFLLGSTMAWADNQDEVFSISGTAAGDSIKCFQPETEYEFAFKVENHGDFGVAIRKVEIAMPALGYKMVEYSAPEALHEDMQWYVDYDEATTALTWESMPINAGSSAELGDIREGDSLTFSFVAITDEQATDGFIWTLTGDDGGTTFTSGVWNFAACCGKESLPCDDDDDASPGDDDAAGSGDDDNDDNACGC